MGKLRLLATNTASGGTTLAVTVPTGGVAVGFTLLLFNGRCSRTITITGVADSRSNTWASLFDSGAVGVVTNRVEVWSTVVTTALQTADTITITYSSTQPAGHVAACVELSNVSTVAMDQSASSTATTASPSSGTSAALSRPDEFVLGLISRNGGSTVASGLTAGFVTISDITSGVGATDQALTLAWSWGTTAGQIYGGSIGSSHDSTAAVMGLSYQDTAPGVVPYGGNPFVSRNQRSRYVD